MKRRATMARWMGAVVTALITACALAAWLQPSMHFPLLAVPAFCG